MAISKVVFGNETLIDITDTTATPMSVSSGIFFYDSSGEKIEGTGPAIGDETEVLSNGGIAHYINGLDLSNDTVTAAALLSGYTAHDSSGTLITGTYVPSSGSMYAYVVNHNLIISEGIIGA